MVVALALWLSCCSGALAPVDLLISVRGWLDAKGDGDAMRQAAFAGGVSVQNAVNYISWKAVFVCPVPNGHTFGVKIGFNLCWGLGHAWLLFLID